MIDKYFLKQVIDFKVYDAHTLAHYRVFLVFRVKVALKIVYSSFWGRSAEVFSFFELNIQEAVSGLVPLVNIVHHGVWGEDFLSIDE